MSKKLVCHIPGNIQLELAGHQKLMALIYTYGADKIAALLDKAQLVISAANNWEVVDFSAELENDAADLSDEFAEVASQDEQEDEKKLQALSEAFKALKVYPTVIEAN